MGSPPKLIEQVGGDAVGATGEGISRACGYPDIGLLTMTEVVMHLCWIVEATTLPVIGDCDTGSGNALNVMQAVREFERVGVAAFHLEDQVTPKRCGHYEGKEVVEKMQEAGRGERVYEESRYGQSRHSGRLGLP